MVSGKAGGRGIICIVHMYIHLIINNYATTYFLVQTFDFNFLQTSISKVHVIIEIISSRPRNNYGARNKNHISLHL